MKNFFLIFGLLLLLIQTKSYAQLDERKVLCLRKIEGYKRMRNTGLIMGGVGLITGIVGITMVSQESSNYNSKTKFFNEERYLTGLSCVSIGLPLATAGTILGLIGNRKVKQYREKLDRLSINFNHSSDQNSFTIKYTF